MEIIDFNSDEFKGFSDGEEILLDTGIILGYLNKYDAWNDTVVNLFNNHIIGNNKALFLFVNPCIINEVTFLGCKPVETFLKNNPHIKLTEQDKIDTEKLTMNSLEELIKNEVFLILDGDKNAVLKQIELYKELGSADSVNASLANEYGINFLTVDGKLTINMKANESKLPDVKKVYYTTGKHMKTKQ